MLGGKVVEIALKLWPLWVALLVAAALGIALTAHNAKVRAEVEAEWKPKLVQCEKLKQEAAQALLQASEAMRQLQASYAEQQKVIRELEIRELEAKARGDRAVAQALAKERVLRTQIAALQAEMTKPAPTPEISCEEADRILREMAVQRSGQ